LLVNRRRPAHADQLLDVFWRDSPPESARRSLYQSVYLLRQALRLDDGRPAIVQAGGGYMLNPDLDVWVDSEVFLQRYRDGVKAAERGGEPAVEAFLAAEALYAGDFMSDEPYEDWPVARREEARDAYLDLLDRLSRHYAAVGQDDLCIAYCHKLLDIDNVREDIHRRLMRLFAGRGERSRALRQYQRCVAALRAELDVDPLPETTDLYVKILNNSFQS
jgi:DNA-binding SARP family transcriptional activator